MRHDDLSALESLWSEESSHNSAFLCHNEASNMSWPTSSTFYKEQLVEYWARISTNQNIHHSECRHPNSRPSEKPRSPRIANTAIRDQLESWSGYAESYDVQQKMLSLWWLDNEILSEYTCGARSTPPLDLPSLRQSRHLYCNCVEYPHSRNS